MTHARCVFSPQKSSERIYPSFMLWVKLIWWQKGGSHCQQYENFGIINCCPLNVLVKRRVVASHFSCGFCKYGNSAVMIVFCILSNTSGSSLTFMEVVKEAARQSSASDESMALRVDQHSYGYFQLILSAWKISNLLRNGDFKNVSCLLIISDPFIEVICIILFPCNNRKCKLLVYLDIYCVLMLNSWRIMGHPRSIVELIR